MAHWLLYLFVAIIVLGFLLGFIGMGWWIAATNSRSSVSSQQWFALTPEAQARERDRILLMAFSPETLRPRRLIQVGAGLFLAGMIAVIIVGNLTPPMSA